MACVANDDPINADSIKYTTTIPDDAIYIRPNPNINNIDMRITAPNVNINDINDNINDINDNDNNDMRIIPNKRKLSSVDRQPQAKRFKAMETKVQRVNENVLDVSKQQDLLSKRLDDLQNEHQNMSNTINSLKYTVEHQKVIIDTLNTTIQSQQAIIDSNNESMRSLRTLCDNLNNNCTVLKNTLEDSSSSQETTNTGLYKQVRQLRTFIQSIRLSIDHLLP